MVSWVLGSGAKRFPNEIIGMISEFIPTDREAPMWPFPSSHSARAVHDLLKAMMLSPEDVGKIDPQEGFIFELEEWRRDPFDYFVGRKVSRGVFRNPFASRRRWRYGDPEYIASQIRQPWPEELINRHRIDSEESFSDLSD